MACKPKSQLRMADGGELMRRFANRQPVRMIDGTPENMAQNRVPMSAQDQGAFNSLQNTGYVKPEAAPAPTTDPGRRERMLAAGQRTQTFQPMMGGISFQPSQSLPLTLRDGGTVPGKGSGDKIPALYEPGEFVVSNDMLDARPGLREQLHDLRGDVLAAKGKTVEEADAQAVKGGTLRAASGSPTDWMSRNLQGQRMTPAPTPMQSMADSLRTPPPVAAATQQARSMPPNSGPQNAPPGYRAGQSAGKGVMQAAKFAGKVAPALGVAIEAGDVYDVAKGPNTTKIDVGTQAAEGISKLAGATAGGLAGAAAGGPFAPLTGLAGGVAGYYAPELATKALRWATGQDTASPIDRVRTQQTAQAALPVPTAQLAQSAQAASAPVSTAQPAPGPQAVTPEDHTASDRLINSAFYNRPRTGMIPGGVDQNGLKYGETWDEGNMNTLRMDGSSLKKYNAGLAERGAGIQVTKDANGQLRLSNSTDPEKMRYVGADGSPTNQYERTGQYAQGMQQLEAARATLRNPDGSNWSARDNATMAANLRDGRDPYQGTSRGEREEDRIPAVGEFGHNRAVAAKLAKEQNATVRRGQDIQSADSRYGHELSTEVSRDRLRYDMNKDQRDYKTGREDKGFEKSQASEKSWAEHANTMFRTVDDKGNSVPDTNKAAEYTQFVDQGIGLMIPRLEQSGDPQKVAYAQRLKAEGRAALDAADKAELPTLFGRQQIHKQTTGSGPFSSGGASSMDPADYRIVGNDNGVFQERVKTKGGQTIPETNLRYGANANRFFWNSGQGSTALLPNKLRGE